MIGSWQAGLNPRTAGPVQIGKLERVYRWFVGGGRPARCYPRLGTTAETTLPTRATPAVEPRKAASPNV